MKPILLSHPINANTPLYGSNPTPSITPYSRISKGDSSNTSVFEMHNHTGTHVDAPKHFIDEGRTISDYTLEELTFTSPLLIDCNLDNTELLSPQHLEPYTALLGTADCILLRTGFEIHRTKKIYSTHNPGISPEAIIWIRTKFPLIRCIGLDLISISSYQKRDLGRQAHREAFIKSKDRGEPLLLIEDMKLSGINGKIVGLYVLPLLLESLDGAPCSVLAFIETLE